MPDPASHTRGKFTGHVAQGTGEHHVLQHGQFSENNENIETDEVMAKVEQKFTIPKIERNNFHFIGLDVKTVEDGIKISMNDYMQSLKDIKEIRKVEDQNEELTKMEIVSFWGQ